MAQSLRATVALPEVQGLIFSILMVALAEDSRAIPSTHAKWPTTAYNKSDILCRRLHLHVHIHTDTYIYT